MARKSGCDNDGSNTETDICRYGQGRSAEQPGKRNYFDAKSAQTEPLTIEEEMS